MRRAGHERQPSVKTTSPTPSAQSLLAPAAHGPTTRNGTVVEPEFESAPAFQVAPSSTEVRLSPDGTFVANGSDDSGFRCERHRQLAIAIRQRIESRLGGRVRDLAVRIIGNTIVLEGRCSTYYTKQLAQHAALGVLNDEQLENAIDVIVPR